MAPEARTAALAFESVTTLDAVAALPAWVSHVVALARYVRLAAAVLLVAGAATVAAGRLPTAQVFAEPRAYPGTFVNRGVSAGYGAAAAPVPTEIVAVQLDAASAAVQATVVEVVLTRTAPWRSKVLQAAEQDAATMQESLVQAR